MGEEKMGEERKENPCLKLGFFLRENWLAAGLGALGVVFILVGLVSLVRQGKEGEIIFESAADSLVNQGKIKVDIEGAVAKPGVYELGPGSRIQDLLILAGGLAGEADREWMAKNLNLAAELQDGGKVYIPKMGEIKSAVIGTRSRESVGGAVGEKVNINTASAEELDRLPGIGPVTAQKIISSRPYQLLEDLLARKVMGQATFEKIKEQITVW